MAKKQPIPPATATVTEHEDGTGDGLDLGLDTFERRPDPAVLAGILVEDALTAEQRRMLTSPDGVALVVKVPSVDWSDAVADALRGVTSFSDMLLRSGASRTTDKPDQGNDRVSGRLARGLRVCGISVAPEQYLPSALVAGADVRLDLAPPTPGQVARAIRDVTGEDPGPVSGVHGLGFYDYVAAIRRGATATACVDRLRAAAVSRSVADPTLSEAPLLRNMPGLEGEARDWSLALAHDFQEYVQGRLSFEALDRCAVFAGEAGVGKTLLVRSIARTLGVPLIATSVASWFGSTPGFLGDVVRECDRVFSAAAAAAPAVLYLDEADGLPRRDRLDRRNADFWKPIIGNILLKLDSATSGVSSRLIVIAATNCAEDLDPALIRPGRLNRVISMRRPSADGIRGILRHHLGPDDLPGADLTGVATLGAGATGAEVTAWVKAARRQARVAARPMEHADLIAQVAPPDDRTREELLACARHEIGHALAVSVLAVGEVVSVTTVRSGDTAGLTRTRLPHRSTMTRAQVDAYVVSILCGRAADEMFGDATTGAGGPAQSDLGMATATLVAAHASLGLGASLLHRAPDAQAVELLRWDADLRRSVDADLRRLYEVAQRLVEAHRSDIEVLAHRLVEARVIGGAEIRAHLAGAAARAPRPARGGRRG